MSSGLPSQARSSGLFPTLSFVLQGGLLLNSVWFGPGKSFSC